MSKRFIMIISVVLLLASVSVALWSASRTEENSQECYSFCRQYANVDVFKGCYAGCMFAKQQ